jgi:aminoglycoside phosphotransferase (APT) family kinase protein
MTAGQASLDDWSEYLDRRWPDRAPVRAVDISRAVGGMARETWFLSTEWDGGSEKIVIRADHADGPPIAVPLRYEHDVYRALAPTGVPVPEALWFEDDTMLLGRPFYVRGMIEGRSTTRSLFEPGHEQARASVGRQVAEHLAVLHTLDWSSHGFGDFMTVPADPSDCAGLELDRWESYFYEHRVDPQPVMAEIFAWLRVNQPRTVDRVSLVWGDVGLGNFILRDERIVGLTDWEYAHLDDPMKDWAAGFMRGLDTLLPREQLFAAYEQASGITVDEERIRYHSVFLNAQYALLAQPTIRQVLDLHGAVDISVVQVNIGFPFGCQQEALRLMDA